jgi:limonene-1,2-epoxide hydrolase
MHGFREQLGLATVDVDLVHVVGGEGVVITERVDHLRADDGSLIASFPVMGALEFDDAGKVRAWREIFDPRAALALLATTNDA